VDEPEEHRSGLEPKSAYARKFRLMLEMIPHPDAGRWTPTKMERATDGEVSVSYFSYLRDGRIDIPRADKIERIARAMDFPPELWFRTLHWWEEVYDRWQKGEDVGEELRETSRRGNGRRISRLLNGLFESRISGQTGQPYTNEGVARLSRGVLSEEEVAAMREGRLADPTWAQVLALCDVFEVDPTYWTERRFPWSPSPALSRAIEDPDSYVVFQNSLKLSKSNRSMLRTLSEHLRREEQRKGGSQEDE
jgi:hypothetical protein